jgi:hypothetical protein
VGRAHCFQPRTTPAPVWHAGMPCGVGERMRGAACLHALHALPAYLARPPHAADVASQNTAVNINVRPFWVSGDANARGCGNANLGSSMGFYLAGPWTKIRYTTSVTGRTSCYSMFGNGACHPPICANVYGHGAHSRTV